MKPRITRIFTRIARIKISCCHPGGIFAVVDAALPTQWKILIHRISFRDRMTYLKFV